jgi:hypothetical protein
LVRGIPIRRDRRLQRRSVAAGDVQAFTEWRDRIDARVARQFGRKADEVSPLTVTVVSPEWLTTSSTVPWVSNSP